MIKDIRKETIVILRLIYVALEALLTEVNIKFYDIQKRTLILGGRIGKK